MMQLSFVETPRVVLEFDPSRQPPDATGPFEWGLFTAALASCPSLSGRGRTAELALSALAERLREFVAEQPARSDLTATGQALIAAQRVPVEALVRWLAERADEPVLYEPG